MAPARDPRYDHRAATVRAEAPGRLRLDNFVVLPYLDTVIAGDGGMLLILGSILRCGGCRYRHPISHHVSDTPTTIAP